MNASCIIDYVMLMDGIKEKLMREATWWHDYECMKKYTSKQNNSYSRLKQVQPMQWKKNKALKQELGHDAIHEWLDG